MLASVAAKWRPPVSNESRRGVGDHPAPTRRVATDISPRYMDDELAEDVDRRNDSEGQAVIEFRPTRITAVHSISD